VSEAGRAETGLARQGRSDRATAIVLGSLSLLTLWGVWELVGRQEGSALAAVAPPPSVFLPAVSGNSFKIGLGSQAVPVWKAVTSSVLRVIGGMTIAFLAAVVTGVAMGTSRRVTMLASPILYLLAPIAPIAWIPIAIVVLGINNLTAIFIVFMGVYFTLTIAALAEIARLPPEYHTIARNLGASPWQYWAFVVFPAVLPSVFTLLRTNFIAAWMAVLVAEMIGLRDGLGTIIMMGRNLFNSDLIMFGMLVIGACGFVIDKLLATIGRQVFWWRV
jgi:NitT/TauT family transport system permease protein